MNHKLVTAVAAAGALLLGFAGGAAVSSMALGTHQSAGASRPTRVPVAQAKAAIQAMLRSAHAPGIRARRSAVAGPDAITNAFYYNWSGYAATGSSGSYTRVSASWTVPALPACTGEHTTNSQWVGLDGFTNSTVEQAGTIAFCYRGTVSYDDWYEMYPTQPSITVEHPVSPGDKVSAHVTRSGTSYTLVVTDSTNPADSFTATATCSTCLNDSVEWISERDYFGSPNGYSPLADYHTWTLTKGSATESGKSSGIGALANLNNVTMVDATDAYDLATASSLSGGNSFTTTWKDSW